MDISNLKMGTGGGMNYGSAGYEGGVGSYKINKKVTKELFVDYHCQSIMGIAARPDWQPVDDKELKCNSEVIFPVLMDDDPEECDEYQMNGRSSDLPDPVTHRSYGICRSWKFDRKVDLEDYYRWCDDGDLMREALQLWINRKLDRIIDAYGLHVIAMSAHKANRGNHAGAESECINLGSEEAPWETAWGIEDLLNNALQAFDENEVTCSMANLIVILPACAIAKLRKEQGTMNICCADDNVRVTGAFKMALGFHVVQSNRLPYCYNSQGQKVYLAMAVDNRMIGSPSELLYMKWEEMGHQMGLFGMFIYDTFVFNPKGVVLMHIVCSKNEQGG